MNINKMTTIHINQSRFGIIAKDPQNSEIKKIGTFGCNPCIGVLCFHPIGIAACAHFSNIGEVKKENLMNMMGSILEKLTGSPYSEKPYEVIIFGGKLSHSDNIVACFKERIKFRSNPMFYSKENMTYYNIKDLRHTPKNRNDYAIDLNGDISPFDMKYGSMNKSDVIKARQSIYEPKLKVQYVPSCLSIHKKWIFPSKIECLEEEKSVSIQKNTETCPKLYVDSSIHSYLSKYRSLLVKRMIQYSKNFGM